MSFIHPGSSTPTSSTSARMESLLKTTAVFTASSHERKEVYQLFQSLGIPATTLDLESLSLGRVNILEKLRRKECYVAVMTTQAIWTDPPFLGVVDQALNYKAFNVDHREYLEHCRSLDPTGNGGRAATMFERTGHLAKSLLHLSPTFLMAASEFTRRSTVTRQCTYVWKQVSVSRRW